MAAVEAEKADAGKRGRANRFIELKKGIAIPIASILILNTVSNTGGATVAGMYANVELGKAMVPIFSIAFTLAILLFAEIMPKTLGAIYCRSVWPFIVRPLTVMNYVLRPAIVVTQSFANMLTRSRAVQSVTEDELLALVRIGAKEGEITDKESRLVHNIIALENKPIKEIMTPRTVIFSLEAQTAVGEAVKATDNKGFTRIPIYEGESENIIGYIITHELFSTRMLNNPEAEIGTILKPISYVPDSVDSLALLTTSVQQRRHIHVVVDEYGGVAGLITLEDLIETLLGDEIVDETDRVVDLRESARRTRLQRPST